MAKLTAHQRRALEMLACGPLRGSTEASLRSKGFDKPMLTDLVHAGLASQTTERVRTGRRLATIAYLRITETGLHVILNHPRALWS
jgi:hypothetical protein